MKKRKHFLTLIIAIFALSIFGCVKPPKVEMIIEIDTNETAFLVPLEGKTKAGQAKFMSLEYLEEAKVATKRITLPQRGKRIGRFSHQITWIPTVRIIKVDRTPITREWTKDSKTGTSKRDQAIWVESKDSIGFSVGVNITALISENNASNFLYYYAGKSLYSVIDENIRGFVTSILSREFGSRSLTNCKTDKKTISELALKETRDNFSDMGISITNLGLVGGLTYEDKEIQIAINEAYVAEMNIKKAGMDRDAQIAINEKTVSIAVAKREAAEEFEKAKEAMIAKVKLEIEQIRAEATRIAARKWNGSVPKNIVPQGTRFLFGLDSSEN